VISTLVTAGEFHPITCSMLPRSLERLAITGEQAISLRQAFLRRKIMYSHARVKGMQEELVRMYNMGESVMDISRKVDFAPVRICPLPRSSPLCSIVLPDSDDTFLWRSGCLFSTDPAPSRVEQEASKECLQVAYNCPDGPRTSRVHQCTAE
jgi:hypothetical protein